jgi:hypothetical protein
LQRMDGFPTAATFPRSAQLDLVRLFGTLRLAEGSGQS